MNGTGVAPPPIFSRSSSWCFALVAQSDDTDVGQNQRAPALLSFEFLQNELLVDDLQLLADAHFPALEIDIVPLKARRAESQATPRRSKRAR